MGWEYSVVYSEGSTSALLNSNKLAVWTSDSCYSDVVYSESPTSASLESSKLAV
jgi:hypothetical protein